VRDYRLAILGAPVRQLLPEQRESVHQALMARNIPAAIRCYRQAVPEAGAAEARNYVLDMFASLRAQFPDIIKPPALSLANLNWPAIAICAVVEGLLAGAIVGLVPLPEPRQATGYYAAAGFVWGIGLMASMRLKGVWKRILAQAPGLAMLCLGPRFDFGFQIASLVVGIFGGACIMISGFTPRRSTHA
jgi:hypothetical protein